MFIPDLTHVLTPGPVELWNGKSANVRHVDLGIVQLPTGAIVACDPFAPYDMDPFVRRLKPGNYLLRLALLDGPSPSIAAATIVVREAVMPSVWEMAIVEGDNLADLEPGDAFGYSVDCGAGCFMDSAIAEKYSEHLASLHDRGIEEELFSAFGREERLLYQFPGAQNGNVAMFRSGDGDGVYSSYFGLDAKGDIVCLTTDFQLVGREPEQPLQPSARLKRAKKPWWRFW